MKVTNQSSKISIQEKTVERNNKSIWWIGRRRKEPKLMEG